MNVYMKFNLISVYNFPYFPLRQKEFFAVYIYLSVPHLHLVTGCCSRPSSCACALILVQIIADLYFSLLRVFIACLYVPGEYLK